MQKSHEVHKYLASIMIRQKLIIWKSLYQSILALCLYWYFEKQSYITITAWINIKRSVDCLYPFSTLAQVNARILPLSFPGQ